MGQYRKTYAGSVERRKIADFIENYYLENGVPPTVEEITSGVGTRSKSTVYYHIKQLVFEGVLRETRSGATARFVPVNCKVVKVEADWGRRAE